MSCVGNSFYFQSICFRFEALRPIIIEKLLEAFSGIRGVKVTLISSCNLETTCLTQVHRAALWILGEYCERAPDMQALMSAIRQVNFGLNCTLSRFCKSFD